MDFGSFPYDFRLFSDSAGQVKDFWLMSFSLVPVFKKERKKVILEVCDGFLEDTNFRADKKVLHLNTNELG